MSRTGVIVAVLAPDSVHTGAQVTAHVFYMSPCNEVSHKLRAVRTDDSTVVIDLRLATWTGGFQCLAPDLRRELPLDLGPLRRTTTVYVRTRNDLSSLDTMTVVIHTTGEATNTRAGLTCDVVDENSFAPLVGFRMRAVASGDTTDLEPTDGAGRTTVPLPCDPVSSALFLEANPPARLAGGGPTPLSLSPDELCEGAWRLVLTSSPQYPLIALSSNAR